MSDRINSEARDRKKNPVGTAAKLAHILRSEGWTDHLANECDRYVRRNHVLSARQVRSGERIEAAMKRITDGMSEGDKMVLGRFVGLHKGMAFDAGLRTGLGVRVQQMAPLLSPDEVERALTGEWTGPSSARAIAAYHAIVTGQDI